MLDPTKVREFMDEIEKKQKDVGKVRDQIDEMISEMGMLREDCVEAWDNLQDARDALSRLV